MANNTATLAIQIISDATKAAKGFQQANAQTSKFESGLKKANKVAVGITASLIAVGAASLKQASDLQQSSGAIKAVFGAQSKEIAKFGKQAAETAGLSQSSYQQLAATFGAQLKNMGVATKQLVPQTDTLIKLGADLAATYGGTTADAVAAVSSLLRGERDPIEKYGVGLKQADINARLAAKGQDKLTGAAKKQAETQATLALLTEQTSTAQGQFAKESNTAEGSAQRMQAKLDNMSASLGTVLLPAAAAASTALAGLAGFVEQHNQAAQVAAVVLASMAAAVFAVNGAMKVYKATLAIIRVATIIFRNAQLALNLAMLANPIGLVVAAAILLIAGLVLLYKKSSTFRTIIQAVGKAGQAAIQFIVAKAVQLWQFISAKLGPVFTSMKDLAVSAFDAVTKPVKNLIEFVRQLVEKIRSIHWPKPPAWVTNAGSGLASLLGSYHDFGGGAALAYAPAVFTAPGEFKASGPDMMLGRVGGRGGPSIVQINVTGALDPNAVAKQIEQLLRRRGIRMGANL